ncbi:hypothetical protein ACFY1P_08600 [Streptomyces sp. NPDC001407]|uniref:hypothetical protein n=1 Tax=unclassified Streptomyces TaxID=2593676 RepID=UPI0033E92DB2
MVHNPLTARVADRIVLLREGRGAAAGSHDQLLARDPVYASWHRPHREPDARPSVRALAGMLDAFSPTERRAVGPPE